MKRLGSCRLFIPISARFTRFGRNAFVNCGCTFMDRGGITIGDGVLIGPGVKLITENHAEEPELRRHVYGLPIVIGRKAWIGAGATVLPGVTVGESHRGRRSRRHRGCSGQRDCRRRSGPGHQEYQAMTIQGEQRKEPQIPGNNGVEMPVEGLRR